MLNRDWLESKAKKIKYFFCDIDGTLTDGVTYYSNDGEALKRFSHVDGTGFHILRNLSIVPGFITGENSKIVQKRADKLQIEHCFLGISDKLAFLTSFAEENKISFESIAYIGDDLNDLSLIKAAGLSFSTANATELCKAYATVVLKKNGGDGAFREAVELLSDWRNEVVWDVFNRNKAIT